MACSPSCWRGSPHSALGEVAARGLGVAGRGLHLLSNLLCYERFSELSSHPDGTKSRFYRIGLINLLAFNSITAGLKEYDTYPFKQLRDSELIVPRLHPFCSESGFHFDDETGQVDVGQVFSKDTLSITAETGGGFWARPKVKEFIKLNPRWEDRDVFISWEWSAANIAAVASAIYTANSPAITAA